MNTEDDPANAAKLRQQAEAIARELALFSANDPALSSVEQMRRTLHELRVHEVELSLQNEELRRTQLELDAARARYFDLYNLAPVGYCTVNELGVVVEANLTIATLLGVTRSELLLRPIHRWIVNADRLPEHEYLGRVFRTGVPESIELRMRNDHGVEFWAHLEATLARDADDKPLCRLTVGNVDQRIQAAAERERLLTRLHRAQQLESLGQFAGGVAHDFNNMLSVILANVEIALEQTGPTDAIRANFDAILKATVRSADLVRQLLALASKQTATPLVLDLNILVTGMSEALRELLGEAISLDWRPQPDLWQVRVDPLQMEQVLRALCLNAKDSIDGAGGITIDTGNSDFDAVYCASHPDCVPGHYVRLAVSDTGRGMNVNTLAHVFEPFFTTKDVGKGMGLGLAAVYGIIRQNKGFVAAVSKPGEGSTFAIHLPRHRGEESAAPPVTRGAAARGGETILLVEDEKAVLAGVSQMLRRLGFKVLAAERAAEALRLAAEHGGTIDMLVTDVIMPEMHGRDLALQLLPLHPNLKVVYMSGYTADIIAPHGVLESGVHFIQKPFSPAGLGAKIRQALDEGGAPAAH